MKWNLNWGVGSLLICTLLISCARDSGLERVLALSDTNRIELERDENDTLKLKASKFLVENIVGFSTPDALELSTYESFYQACDSFRIKYRGAKRSRCSEVVDSLWREYSLIGRQRVKSRPIIKTIMCRQFIGEIGMAFEAWHKNVFTKECAFVVTSPNRNAVRACDN